jgi:hypothetical protein
MILKGKIMSNFVFACASVNGLTLAQKRETLKALRAAIKEETIIRKQVRADAKVAKEAAKAEKAAAREAKRAAAIAKLEARLAKLANPKKPGKVQVFKGAAAEARLSA